MSIKDQALRALGELPDDCTWEDVYRTVAREASKPMVVREFRQAWGEPAVLPEHRDREVGMSYDFDVVVERDTEGLYVGSVPALQGCHTQAASLDQLLERMREAVELCLEVSGGRPSDTGFVGIRRISVPV